MEQEGNEEQGTKIRDRLKPGLRCKIEEKDGQLWTALIIGVDEGKVIFSDKNGTEQILDLDSIRKVRVLRGVSDERP